MPAKLNQGQINVTVICSLIVGIPAFFGGMALGKVVSQTEPSTAANSSVDSLPPIPRSVVYLAKDDLLQDLQGVKVVVGSLGDDAKPAGLTVASLKTMIELRLRQLRVPVLSDSDAQRSLDPRSPQLYLKVGVLDISNSPLFTYNLSLQLREIVEVLLDGSSSKCHITLATTWESPSRNGYAGSRVVKEAITGSIREMVDVFANSYLASHAASPP